MFDASFSASNSKNTSPNISPVLCSETCWGPDIGHSSHKRDGWHNRQRPRDHQPFQSLRWLDFCHVAVNSQVCSLGTRVLNVDLEVFLFLQFQRGWFFFNVGHPLINTNQTRLYPIATRHRPPFPPRLPWIIRSEGRCFSSRKLGLWSRVKATPSHALPFFVPSTAVLSWVKTVALEVSACPKKKTERSSKPTMFRLLEKRNGWWKSWIYGILPNTQGNLWIYMLLHPVCFEIVFTNHKPFLPLGKLRLVDSVEKNILRLGLGLLPNTTPKHDLVESYWAWDVFDQHIISPDKFNSQIHLNSGGNSRQNSSPKNFTKSKRQVSATWATVILLLRWSCTAKVAVVPDICAFLVTNMWRSLLADDW